MKTLRKDYHLTNLSGKEYYENIFSIKDYYESKGIYIDIIEFEGTSNDFYTINLEGLEPFKIDGLEYRKYLLAFPQFLNHWQDSLNILLTDDKEKFNNFVDFHLSEFLS